MMAIKHGVYEVLESSSEFTIQLCSMAVLKNVSIKCICKQFNEVCKIYHICSMGFKREPMEHLEISCVFLGPLSCPPHTTGGYIILLEQTIAIWKDGEIQIVWNKMRVCQTCQDKLQFH